MSPFEDLFAMTEEPVAFDANGEGTVTVDGEVTIVFKRLEDTGKILGWAVVARLEDDALAADRARLCLEAQEMKQRTRGLTLGLDRAERRLIAFDIRPEREFASSDDVAAWIEAFTAFIGSARALLDRNYPSYDDSDLDLEVR